MFVYVCVESIRLYGISKKPKYEAGTQYGLTILTISDFPPVVSFSKDALLELAGICVENKEVCEIQNNFTIQSA